MAANLSSLISTAGTGVHTTNSMLAAMQKEVLQRREGTEGWNGGISFTLDASPSSRQLAPESWGELKLFSEGPRCRLPTMTSFRRDRPNVLYLGFCFLLLRFVLVDILFSTIN